MRIPFGKKAPSEEQVALLKKIGFTEEHIIDGGQYFYLAIPDDPDLRCEQHNPAFDRRTFDLSFRGKEVVSVSQKTAIYDQYVYCDIDSDAIEEAIQLPKLEPSQEKQLSAYQHRLAERLSQLEFIIFEDGADRGYGKMISAQFPYLKELQAENPQEYRELMDSNPRYLKLEEMFPDWIDRHNLQSQYEARDAGPFAAMAASPGCKMQ